MLKQNKNNKINFIIRYNYIKNYSYKLFKIERKGMRSN